MRGSRSHGGIVPAVASRNLSSEASAPGSAAACQQQSAGRGADTPATCVARVGTVTTGSAPAFGRALAPCYGSDLLTLRLHFALQLGDVVFRAAPRKEVFRALPGPVFPRELHALYAPCLFRARAFLARSSRQSTPFRAGLRSSNLIPLGKLRGRTDRNSPYASLGSSAVSHRALPHSS